MRDQPDHFPIDVDKDGNGPVEGDAVVATLCWCGNDFCEPWRQGGRQT